MAYDRNGDSGDGRPDYNPPASPTGGWPTPKKPSGPKVWTSLDPAEVLPVVIGTRRVKTLPLHLEDVFYIPWQAYKQLTGTDMCTRPFAAGVLGIALGPITGVDKVYLGKENAAANATTYAHLVRINPLGSIEPTVLLLGDGTEPIPTVGGLTMAFRSIAQFRGEASLRQGLPRSPRGLVGNQYSPR